MDPDDPIRSFLLLFALLCASAFFVAAEFALLTLRRRRSEHSDSENGGRGGVPVEPGNAVREAVQLLGVVAFLLFAHTAATVANRGLAGAVGPVPATYLGLAGAAVVAYALGQQVPRLLGVQRFTWVAHPIVAWPLRLLGVVLRPITLVAALLVDGAARILGLSRAGFDSPVYTLEEIRELVSKGHEQGVVEEDEREMIRGVFDFSDTVAREVMTPRIDLIAVPVDVGLAELVHIAIEEGHSRIPVYEGTIDSIVGVVLTKDLLPLLADPGSLAREPFDVSLLMREVYFVPDTKPVDDILSELRQAGVHLAVVIDEFGGTYGIVTLEDLLEEIVGEIQDEYDVEEPEFAPTPEGDVLIDGGASISEVNERFGLALPEEDFDTLGGYIFGALGRVPVAGDRLEAVGDWEFLEVEEAEERRVTRVRLRRGGGVVLPEG